MTDDQVMAQLYARIHELEAQIREESFAHHALAKDVMHTVLQLIEENRLAMTALTEILDLRVGVLQIAEEAQIRIQMLRMHS